MHLEAVCAALVVAIWLAFWGVRSSGFVTYDDGSYILENPVVRKGLSPRSVGWAFTTTAVANWHPVTWLSHMLDVQLFGLNAGRHHGVNLLFHTLNALILLLLLKSLTGSLWRSAFAAFLFALHPLHVESVAWIAERKDVLSTLFWLLTLAAWLAYVRSRRPAWYGLSLLLFTLGLMAKPMLVTLPFTMVLLDFWPLGRLAPEPRDGPRALLRLLLEKAPFFALSAASCAVTFLAQRAGGTVASIQSSSFAGRLANAVWAYAAYLFKTVWPTSLAVFYPLPPLGHPTWQVAFAAALLLAATVGCIGLWKRAPYLLFGWLWFVGTLVPVIGFVQVGAQSMADRYTYVPLIGIFVAAAWGLGSLASGSRPLRYATAATCGAILVAFFAVTRVQVSYWSDSVALFEHALAVAPDNFVAHANLGVAMRELGRMEEAADQFRMVLKFRPDQVEAHDGLGKALFSLGRFEEAAREHREAVRLEPESAEAHTNLGMALGAMGRLQDASEQFALALKLRPEDATAHNSMGRALAGMGRFEEAAAHHREAIRLRPEYAEAYNDLGITLGSLGRTREASDQFRTAIRLKPDYAEAHNNLGINLARDGRLPEAAEQFREALRTRPDLASARTNIEHVEAALRGGPNR